MIRNVLLASGFLLMLLGCGNNYYTYYPKYWIPADRSEPVDDQAIARARGECRMKAIEQKYPDRGSYFTSCMNAKGYVDEYDFLGRLIGK